jgi:hypothetical protein
VGRGDRERAVRRKGEEQAKYVKPVAVDEQY